MADYPMQLPAPQPAPTMGAGPSMLDRVVDWMRNNRVLPAHAFPNVGGPRNPMTDPVRRDFIGEGDIPLAPMAQMPMAQGWTPGQRQSTMVIDQRARSIDEYIKNLTNFGAKTLPADTSPGMRQMVESENIANIGAARRYKRYENLGSTFTQEEQARRRRVRAEQ